MISHTKNFIFIHIPKTGGTSIEHGLRPYGKLLQGVVNFESIYYKHVTASALQRMLGPSEYAAYFKFTFVRNPWDWIVSNYAFNRGLCRPYVIGTKYTISGKVPDSAKDVSFSDWLRWWIEELSPSQSTMVVDDEGRLMVDFVGRFEHLESDFHRLCTSLGLPTAALPHLKASEHGPYMEYYDETTRQLVIEHFKTDFELFGYPFHP